MYSLLFFENSRFLTQVGGPVNTLPEALEQVCTLKAGLDATDLEGYFGFKYDRNGTPCALLVADRWGMPLKNVEDE